MGFLFFKTDHSFSLIDRLFDNFARCRRKKIALAIPDKKIWYLKMIQQDCQQFASISGTVGPLFLIKQHSIKKNLAKVCANTDLPNETKITGSYVIKQMP